MVAAQRTLARDGWVLGIACAAALAYAVVSLVEESVTFVLSVVDGYPVFADETIPNELDLEPPHTVVINGHYVSYEGLVRALVLLAVVVIVSALALHATRAEDKPET
jgi:hypothetical protein